MLIDVTFDFRTDSGGRDPDTYSPTLRRYHKLLWTKPLPDGRLFDLDDSFPGAYLRHSSPAGEFVLTSDSVIATMTRWKSMKPIIDLIPDGESEEFRRLGYTIGGMLIFPGYMVDRRPTINAARGFNPKIKDRLDLTLECIRRYYANQASPLSDVLDRYDPFFRLFQSFAGYTEFFLLQDLLNPDGSIKFFTTFQDFQAPAAPQDRDTYLQYRRRSIAFITARNRRIALKAVAPSAAPNRS